MLALQFVGYGWERGAGAKDRWRQGGRCGTPEFRSSPEESAGSLRRRRGAGGVAKAEVAEEREQRGGGERGAKMRELRNRRERGRGRAGAACAHPFGRAPSILGLRALSTGRPSCCLSAVPEPGRNDVIVAGAEGMERGGRGRETEASPRGDRAGCPPLRGGT